MSGGSEAREESLSLDPSPQPWPAVLSLCLVQVATQGQALPWRLDSEHILPCVLRPHPWLLLCCWQGAGRARGCASCPCRPGSLAPRHTSRGPGKAGSVWAAGGNKPPRAPLPGVLPSWWRCSQPPRGLRCSSCLLSAFADGNYSASLLCFGLVLIGSLVFMS